MKQVTLKIEKNTALTHNVFEMKLRGDNTALTKPGQFVNLKLSGFYLRRPISVCDVCGDELTLIYKVVGEGTAKMAQMRPGEELSALSGLGNGYDTSLCGERPLLVGGGVGVPPLYGLCKMLVSEGKKPTVIMRHLTKGDIFYKDEFEALGTKLIIATFDGSFGVQGGVAEASKGLDFDYIFTCGSMNMMKNLYNATDCPGQFSLEERMGCGFGACMGCTCKTKDGYKRVCNEGPIFYREEIIW